MKKVFFLLFLYLAALHSSELPQTYFSPKDHIADRLIALIEKERTSLQIAVYCFTHREIAQAIVDAKLRGVAVELIIDPYSIKANIPVDKMLEAGIPVYVWAPPSKSMRKPIMHHKFCVFGDGLLWTGSFNFTYQANKANQENVIVIDMPEVIQKYKEQFEALKKGPCMRYKEYLNAYPKNDLPQAKMTQKLIDRSCQSPGIEIVECGGSIAEIQPPPSTTQSRELSLRPSNQLLSYLGYEKTG